MKGLVPHHGVPALSGCCVAIVIGGHAVIGPEGSCAEAIKEAEAIDAIEEILNCIPFLTFFNCLIYSIFMSSFSSLTKAPEDPIFTIAEEAKRAGSAAIDASIGVILNDYGELYAFHSVEKAMEQWTKQKKSYGYSPLLGTSGFRSAVTSLLFGNDSGTIATLATTGGTGAVTLNLLLARECGITKILLSVPSWPNHKRIAHGLGMTVTEVPFLEGGQPLIEPLLSVIKEAREPHVLLLQGEAHNPTGKSWSGADWKALAQALAGKNHLVLLDFAYQGLGQGIQEDTLPLQILREANVSLLVAWSAAKNHGMYGLRAGLAAAVTASEEEKENAEAWFRILTRQIHSGAASTGQELVAIVQTQFHDEWEKEIDALRDELTARRTMLADGLPQWKSWVTGSGLFTMLPLTKDAIQKLKQEKVFVTDDGRVNIGGLPQQKMEAFISKIQSVSRQKRYWIHPRRKLALILNIPAKFSGCSVVNGKMEMPPFVICFR